MGVADVIPSKEREMIAGKTATLAEGTHECRDHRSVMPRCDPRPALRVCLPTFRLAWSYTLDLECMHETRQSKSISKVAFVSTTCLLLATSGSVSFFLSCFFIVPVSVQARETAVASHSTHSSLVTDFRECDFLDLEEQHFRFVQGEQHDHYGEHTLGQVISDGNDASKSPSPKLKKRHILSDRFCLRLASTFFEEARVDSQPWTTT